MIPNIEDVLGKITWGDFLKWGPLNWGPKPCVEVIEYVEGTLGLEKETRLNSDYLNMLRKHNPKWAEGFLYYAARLMPNFTGEERFSLVSYLESNKRIIEAARCVPDLTNEQRFGLVSSFKDKGWRRAAGQYVPKLTKKQEKELGYKK